MTNDRCNPALRAHRYIQSLVKACEDGAAREAQQRERIARLKATLHQLREELQQP